MTGEAGMEPGRETLRGQLAIIEAKLTETLWPAERAELNIIRERLTGKIEREAQG